MYSLIITYCALENCIIVNTQESIHDMVDRPMCISFDTPHWDPPLTNRCDSTEI